MIKAEELTNPSSCMSKAEPTEMTFVLLARDSVAPAVIREWCRLRCLHGNNSPKDVQIVEALACAERMEEQRETRNQILTALEAFQLWLAKKHPTMRLSKFQQKVVVLVYSYGLGAGASTIIRLLAAFEQASVKIQSKVV